jgi:hypothetical protein
MGQHVGDALDLIRPDLAGVPVLKQTLEASTTERPYHKVLYRVSVRVSRSSYWLLPVSYQLEAWRPVYNTAPPARGSSNDARHESRFTIHQTGLASGPCS